MLNGLSNAGDMTRALSPWRRSTPRLLGRRWPFYPSFIRRARYTSVDWTPVPEPIGRWGMCPSTGYAGWKSERPPAYSSVQKRAHGVPSGDGAEALSLAGIEA